MGRGKVEVEGDVDDGRGRGLRRRKSEITGEKEGGLKRK